MCELVSEIVLGFNATLEQSGRISVMNPVLEKSLSFWSSHAVQYNVF